MNIIVLLKTFFIFVYTLNIKVSIISIVSLKDYCSVCYFMNIDIPNENYPMDTVIL